MFQEVKQRHEKVLIVGGGESLKGFDISLIKDFTVITVNNVIFHIPKADYWITVDPMLGNRIPQKAMTERSPNTYYYCAYPDLKKTPNDDGYYSTVDGVHYLERIVPKKYRLQEDKDKITTGDSIYGALGLAYHFEAKKIGVLGLDGYGAGHWYDNTPYNAQSVNWFDTYLNNLSWIYPQCLEQFNARGCKILNGSPKSRYDCFERTTPERVIKWLKS